MCWEKMASSSRFVLHRVLRGLSAHSVCYHSSVLSSWHTRLLWKPQVRLLSCSHTLCHADPPTTGTVQVTSSITDHDWMLGCVHWLCLWTVTPIRRCTSKNESCVSLKFAQEVLEENHCSSVLKISSLLVSRMNVCIKQTAGVVLQ